MQHTENFGFRLSRREKALLKALSEIQERTASDFLRRLIRHAAQQHGLLSRGETQVQSENVQQRRAEHERSSLGDGSC